MSVQRRRRPAQGFSLIELMVAIVIGLVVTLAVSSVLSNSENRKRTTTSTNDINLTGAFTLYSLDQVIRSAGTGFAQSYGVSFGCQLNASKTGFGQILPVAGALPTPFNQVIGGTAPASFRLAPVIIAAGRSAPGVDGVQSDVLITMGGSAGFGESALQSLGLPTSTGGTGTLSLLNNISFQPNDKLLMADTPGATITPCLFEQVAPTFVPGSAGTLPLAGAYFANAGPVQQLTSYSADAQALNLGQQPSFRLWAAGANAALYSYDLLNPSATANLVSEGVIDMRALYFVDTNADGVPDTWRAPTTEYADTALLDGTPAGAAAIVTIKAVHIGIILRSSLQDANAIKAAAGTPAAVVTPGPLQMFTDPAFNGLVYTRNLNADDQKYRYRVLETTIPVRNALLIP
jgi:type IV pilus assembly protein PilW